MSKNATNVIWVGAFLLCVLFTMADAPGWLFLVPFAICGVVAIVNIRAGRKRRPIVRGPERGDVPGGS